MISSVELRSYSEYWTTDYRPLFIITNAITSYYLFSVTRWRVSALFLLIVTAFSYDQYFYIHTISAIAFFIYSGIAIAKTKKFELYAIPYFSSLFVLVIFGILWAEVFAIFVMSVFHLNRLIRFRLIEIKRNS